MEEILFRGKTIDTQEWIEGDYSHSVEEGDNGLPEVYYKETATLLEYINDRMVYQDSVGQYVCIEDDSGIKIKIFEGDICSYTTPDYFDNGIHYVGKTEIGVVNLYPNGVNFGGWQYSTPFGGMVSNIKVIGNKHQRISDREVLEGEFISVSGYTYLED
jgi:hypothetical protein